MENWYPEKIVAGNFGGAYNTDTVDFIVNHSGFSEIPDLNVLTFAEIGIWKGGTSCKLAEFLNNKGTLYLFDYADNLDFVMSQLKEKGYKNIRGFPSTQKYLDSYNWNLGNLLRETGYPLFDYIFIDGAHTWAIDALTFFLADKLLKKGGYLDFDDYNWRLRGSSLDPGKVPETELFYTDEQIDSMQVKMIVDVLVRTSGSYTEIVKNKIFKKTC
jgi:hypothetical protein